MQFAKSADCGTEVLKSHCRSHPQSPLTLESIFTLENLIQGSKSASKGKRNTRRAYRFSMYEAFNLIRLLKLVLDGTYRPAPPKQFTIWCKSGQKTRVISAPAYKDLVVQHVIYRETYAAFEKGWIHDSYGCRIGGGTHRAADRCQQFMRQSPPDSFYLQLDIRKFYYSIDHSILRQSIERRIKDPRLVDLMMKFCDDGSGSGVGLCVGSLLSQMYGLIYLDRLDHFIKRRLKVKRYIRYVDDMVIIGETKERCYELREAIEAFIREELHLEFSKWIIAPLKRGINFVGYRTWRSRRFVRRRAMHTFSKRLRQRNVQALISILGHARHTSSYSYMVGRVKAAGVSIPQLNIRSNE